MSDAPILEVRNLTVSVALSSGGHADVVRNLSFTVDRGGTLGLVGESGSGKTMTSLAIMGLLPPAARVESGEILFEGRDLLKMSRRALQRLRGRRMSMVMQDPMTALDPMFTIRDQLAEPLRQHRGLRGQKLNTALVKSLEQVHLSAARERLSQYPHQLSGGMRQRVVSAISLAGQARLLIADEPTTALDVTTQARYLELLQELQEAEGFALILVAHDLHIVRRVCQQVIVMYASQEVEKGPTELVFSKPQHPYTRALLGAIPVLSENMQLLSIEGQAPDPAEALPGCRFVPRCEFRRDVCAERPPQLTPRAAGSSARCWATEAEGWLAT